MTCAQIEVLICDYIDGTLAAAERGVVEAHLRECPACKELASDAAGAVLFLENVARVEPPPELLTRLLFHVPAAAESALNERGWRGWVRRWLEPVLQPRFAMGLAMTILSFSMVGRIVGFEPRQLTMADLNPVQVWGSIDDRLHRVYDRAVKYYDNLRLVYEIQARLREWSAQEEEDRRANSTAIEPLTPAGAQPESSGSNKR